tara:strand:- start:200 stop:430 length:231 start_codon:yes stop_codon:yes gene_type:complete
MKISDIHDSIIFKIAEKAVESAPRFTEDGDLLIAHLVKELNLKSDDEIRWTKEIVNNAIKQCKQGKGSDLKKNFIK